MCAVVDSAVWFSMHCGELHFRVLGLGTRICAADVVVLELIGNPNGTDLVARGLTVREVQGKYIAQTIQWRAQAPELSVADVFSLALALQENYRLATRDSALERLAGQVGVEVIHVTGVLEMMAEAGLLAETDIGRFKKGMHQADRAYDKAHLDRVLKMVRSARQGHSDSSTRLSPPQHALPHMAAARRRHRSPQQSLAHQTSVACPALPRQEQPWGLQDVDTDCYPFAPPPASPLHAQPLHRALMHHRAMVTADTGSPVDDWRMI